MFNDVGPLELVTLVVLAVIVFGPEKLPKVVQDISRFIRKIREFSDSAKTEIREELGPEFKDFEFEDLNPKAFLRKQLDNDELGLREIRDGFDLKKELAEVTDAVNGKETSAPSGAKADLTKPSGTGLDMTKKPESAAAERPPYDLDAT